METKTAVKKPRQKRRSNVAIQNAIFSALKALIEEVGFVNITAAAVIKRANIEPIVFEKRYKSLGDLFDKFIATNDFWFTEIPNFNNITNWELYYIRVLKELIKSLPDNKLMQRVLLWELEEDNPTTVRTATVRDAYSESLMRSYDDHFQEKGIEEIRSVTATLIAGIYYLILHRERSTFCGVNYDSKAGMEQLSKGIDLITSGLFAQRNQEEKMLQIARNFKAQGVSAEIIAQCTELDIKVIEE